MNYTSLIEAQTLHEYLGKENIVIIDCRFSLQDTEKGYQQYLAEHIPGAYYAHLDKDLSGAIIPGKTGRHPLPKADNLVALFSSWGIDEGKQVVVYDNKSGAIAARLWWLLRWLGHHSVAVLNGGWKIWNELGLPTDNKKPSPKAANFIAKEQQHLKVDASFVEKVRENEYYHLVDSRAARRYQGIEEPIDPVAGHIPGAINLSFMENVNDNGVFIEKEKLKNRFSNLKEASKTVFYCGSGVTACHNILAYFHAGLGEALLYPGSWSEWITDENRPVKTQDQ